MTSPRARRQTAPTAGSCRRDRRARFASFSAIAAVAALALFPASAGGAQAPSDGGKSGKPELFDQSVKAAVEAVEQYGPYDAPEQLERVNRIGFALLKHADFDRYPFSFGLVDMPVPNAFALPGGQIFVTRGLLDLEPTDDMLANVLGHEITHVTHEHYVKMQKRATLMNVLGNALIIGVLVGADRNRQTQSSAGYDPLAVPDNGNVVEGAAAASLVVSELLLRSYSRENETDSDDEGQRLAAAAGFDPAAAESFWKVLNARAPQAREYGYWQTHPFAEERMRAARIRAGELKIQDRNAADALRQKTQTELMNWLERTKPGRGEVAFVKQAALATWPQGATADSLRLERLHGLREEALARPLLARDYGAVLTAYRGQRREVEALTPQSELLKKLDTEIADLEGQAKAAYPKAVEVLEGGVFETSFLEAFLSNYPDSPRLPEVALALGDAYARLGDQTSAVARYLRAVEAGAETPAGARAHAGLRALAPGLDQLAALQEIAEREKDPTLRAQADARIAKLAGTFDDLANGAEYLKKFPEGAHVPAVIERLNRLADDLYGEVVLYQGVGESLKAIDRINRILTHAPLSPAAAKLRDSVVVAGDRAG